MYSSMAIALLGRKSLCGTAQGGWNPVGVKQETTDDTVDLDIVSESIEVLIPMERQAYQQGDAGTQDDDSSRLPPPGSQPVFPVNMHTPRQQASAP